MQRRKRFEKAYDNMRRKIGIALSLLVLVFLLSEYFLALRQIYYRAGVEAAVGLTAQFVLPLLFWKFSDKNLFWNIIYGILFFVWAALIGLIMLFGIDDQKQITKKLIVANEAGFLQENTYRFYRPKALLWKVPVENYNSEDQKDFLERKYDRKFYFRK